MGGSDALDAALAPLVDGICASAAFGRRYV
jgi:hypothetical protein